jgi:hypothetical protein
MTGRGVSRPDPGSRSRGTEVGSERCRTSNAWLEVTGHHLKSLLWPDQGARRPTR